MSIANLVPKCGSRGFTLLELIVVIVILGILAALAIPTFARVIATSELEVAEVTAASVVRETLALSAFNQEGLITEDSIITAAADLPGRVAYSGGTYAADAAQGTPYRVVFGKWEFSGNDRTISAVRSGAPVGSSVGVALYVPEIGCAFAKSEGNNVGAWSVMGLDPTSCNGAGAFLSPEELLELSAPPIPDGLEVTFGCSSPDGKSGWNITFDSGMVDVFINGVYVGQYASGACVPGNASDKVTVVPSSGSTPGWTGGIGGVFNDGSSELPGEPETPAEPEVSAPVLSDGTAPILVEWAPTAGEGTNGGADGVIVSRQPSSGGNGGSGSSWSPVYTGGIGGSNSSSSGGGYIYDSAPSGNWVYQVQPTLGGQSVGAPAPVTVVKVATPTPVTSDGGTAPTVVLIGDSATIAWGAVADARTAPLTGYRVYRSVNAGAYALVSSSTKATASITNGPLSAGTYCYKLSSYGPGGESGKTAEACVALAQPNWNTGTISKTAIATPGQLSTAATKPLAVDGDTMVVSSGHSYASPVYVYIRSNDTWALQASLLGNDVVAGDGFGQSVDIEGDTIVVGSGADDDKGLDSGSAYVFTRTANVWSQQIKLTDSNGQEGDSFGGAVAISGGLILVSSQSDDDQGDKTGSVSPFNQINGVWSQADKLYSNTAAVRSYFGNSLSMSGNTAVIGAFRDSTRGVSASGAAYVFRNSNGVWAQEAKLFPAVSLKDATFGWTSDIDGDTIVIGARTDTDKVYLSGTAYVFIRNGTTWTQQAKLSATDAGSQDHFGQSVAINGDRILVGARADDDVLEDSGSAYIFARSGTTWAQQAKLAPSDPVKQTYFGYAVAFDGENALVARINTGSGVHIFKP